MGAKKWCTLHAVLLSGRLWSYRSLAAGTWPTQRHDGAEGGALHTGTTLALSGVAQHLRLPGKSEPK